MGKTDFDPSWRISASGIPTKEQWLTGVLPTLSVLAIFMVEQSVAVESKISTTIAT
jgi:hypothetical protein